MTKTPYRDMHHPDLVAKISEDLRETDRSFKTKYPGDSTARQPVHTVYGGAQLFTAETPRKFGKLALLSLESNAGSFAEFARALSLPGSETLPKSSDKLKKLEKLLAEQPGKVRTRNPAAWRLHTLFNRVIEKLRCEPVEDLRIDFEDGYGYRTDAEEDHHAETCARAMARAMHDELFPPFSGIRIKPLTGEGSTRAARTLEVFVSTLAHETRGRVPRNFAVTLPKVTGPEQVNAMMTLCAANEAKLSLAPGTLALELMIETPQVILDADGRSAIPRLLNAGAGRVRGLHFGPYDFTSLCDITAAHQQMQHPTCDFARQAMKVALAQTGITMSDGPTNMMPIGPHRTARHKRFTARQRAENRAVVHRSWQIAFNNIMHSLRNGIYQGWDLHPAQLPVRYAAMYSFFLEELDLATRRLRSLVEKAAQASLVGDVFDDAATGQGLLNFFLRGIHCGAITEEEARATGLTPAELRSKSFVMIGQGKSPSLYSETNT